MNKSVEIYVACHKPSFLPDNDLYVPIHVGAERSKISMPIRKDNEGDNISEKNPHYCEMTAQYWAFKHSDADYIGLCHYRRYLSFCDEQFSTYTGDKRKHVLIPALTERTAERYGLTNKEEMLRKIGDCDIAVSRPMDLSKVYTPQGYQKTVLMHWLAHDREFFRKEDLKKLYYLVKKYYPDVYPDMEEYMNGKYFYGYNTFVMRKDLFRAMSAFEFDILSRLERMVDLSEYSPQANRIFGFMGEILFSSYVYHLKKRHPALKVRECQMLYFERTDPQSSLLPAFPEEKNAVQIVIDLDGQREYLAEPVLRTLLKNRNKKRCYDIVLVIKDQNKTGFYKKYYTGLSIGGEISIRTVSPEYIEGELTALYGKADYNTQVFLPWLLPDWKRCLYLKWNVLVNAPADEIYDTDMGNASLAGAVDVEYAGRLNSWKEEDREYLSEVLKADRPETVLYNAAVVMDLESLRKQNYSLIARFMREASAGRVFYKVNALGKEKRYPSASEIYCIVFPVALKILSQDKIHLLESDDDTSAFINEAPLALVNQHKRVQSAGIEIFSEDAWWKIGNDPEFCRKYWNIIDESPLKALFYADREKAVIKEFFSFRRLPDAMRESSLDILPYNSLRRDAVKAVYKGIKKFI